MTSIELPFQMLIMIVVFTAMVVVARRLRRSKAAQADTGREGEAK